MTARKKRHALVRIPLKIAKWLVLAVVGLVLLVYLGLQTGPGRGLVRNIAVNQVNQLIRGRLVVESIETLTVGTVRLVGVVLEDPDGQPVAEVADVIVQYDLPAIIRGDIEIRRVLIDGPHLWLNAGEDGQITLLSAIALRNPPAPEPEPQPEPPAGEPTSVGVAELLVTNGRATIGLPEARGLGLKDLALAATLRLREQVELDVRHVSMTVLGPDGRPLLRLDPVRAGLQTGDGEVSRVSLSLLGAEDRLYVDASVRGLGGSEPLQFEVRLRLDPLTGSLLDVLGLSDLLAQLPEWVSGEIRAWGTLDDIQAEVEIETPGGPLAVRAHYRGLDDADLSVRTAGLALSAASPALPEMELGIDLAVAMRPGPEAEERRFEVRLAGGQLDGKVVPAVSIDAIVGTESVVLEALTIPALGDRLRLSGSYAFTGEVEAHIAIDDLDLHDVPLLEELVPGHPGGRVDADLDAHLALGDDPRLRARGELGVRGLRLGDLSADRIELEGRVSGRLSAPRVDLRIAAANLGTPDVLVASADVQVAGGPTDYRLDGRAQLADGPRASFDLQAGWRDERLTLAGDLLASQDGETIEANLRDIAFEVDQRLEIGSLRLRHPEIDLRVSGLYDFESGADLEAEITRLDLGVFDGRLFLPDLPLDGVVSGEITVSGQPDDPTGRVDLSWARGEAGPLEAIDLDLQVIYRRTGIEASGRVEVGDMLSVVIDGEAVFERPAEPMTALAEARYDMTVTLDAADLSLLATVLPDSPLQSGALQGAIRLRGPLDGPSGHVELTATRLAVEGAPTISFWTMIGLEESELTAALDAWDDYGRLVTLRGEAGVGWDDLTGGDLVEALQEAPFELSFDVPERPLDSFGVDIGTLAEVPLLASMDVSMTREPRRFPIGEVRLRLASDPGAERLDFEVCESEQPIELTVDALLQEGQSVLQAALRVGGERRLSWAAATATPFRDWADLGEIEELPPVAARLEIESLDLATLPLLCLDAAGTLDGELNVRGVLTDSPIAELVLAGRALAFRTGDPIDLELRAELDTSSLQADVGLLREGVATATLTAGVPIVWNAETPVPALGDGPLAVRIDLDEFEVGPIGAFITPLRRGVGTIDGYVAVNGPIDALEPEGELELARVVVNLPGLDQRLSNVNGHVTITPERIELVNLRAHDRDGLVEIDGTIEMAGLAPSRVLMTLEADNFPTRSAGLIVARLSARAETRVTFGDDAIETRVVFRDLSIRLPETAARSVLGLDANPDIVFVDARGLAARADAEEDAAEVGEAEPGLPLLLLIDATRPFWVRRSDFAIQLTADLRIQADRDGVILSGPVDFRRGFFDLLGKTFDLEEGSITFTGSREVDPALSIVAVHNLSRYPGQTVTASISGRLTEPTLEFSTTVEGVETDAEIIQLLVTGRVEGSGTERSAGQQVASFLSGLTAGLLTMTARNELGDAVPVISVQTGDDLRDVQVRAGFVVDSIIPSFMRDVVTGVYVEGFVETSSEEGGESNQREQVTTGGVLIELYYPNGWITAGTFQPPSNWSLNVLWQP